MTERLQVAGRNGAAEEEVFLTAQTLWNDRVRLRPKWEGSFREVALETRPL